MTKTIAITDDGIIPVAMQFTGPDGTPTAVTISLDLYEAVNAYGAFRELQDDPITLHTAWVEWLTAKGFPPMSHRAGVRIIECLFDRLDALKKADGGSTTVG